MAETLNIKGEKIFSIGTWNGVKVTSEDLDSIVESFGHVGFEPPLKLGHNNKQELLKKDGLNAAGWVKAIRRIGNDIIADFENLPKKVFELINKGAYKNKSVEIYHSYKAANGKIFKRVLKAVALLGADIPAVESLDDMLALYDDEGREYKTVVFGNNKEFDITPTLIFSKEGFTRQSAIAWAKSHNFKSDKIDETSDNFRLRQKNPEGEQNNKQEDNKMPDEKKKTDSTHDDEKTKKLQKELDETKLELATFKKSEEDGKTEQKNFSDKLDKLAEKLKTTQDQLAVEQNKSRELEIDKKIEKLSKADKIHPAQGAALKTVLMALDESTKVKLFSKDNKEKEFSISDAIVEVVNLTDKTFSTKEITQEGKKIIEEGQETTDDIDIKIKSYCKENSMNYNKSEDYKTAFRAVG